MISITFLTDTFTAGWDCVEAPFEADEAGYQTQMIEPSEGDRLDLFRLRGPWRFVKLCQWRDITSQT